MVIRTERSPQEEQLVAAFRAVFDASVMNFGSYNLLYAANLFGREEHPELLSSSEAPAAELSAQEAVESARHLIVGYRREPAELVLCPVDPAALLPRMKMAHPLSTSAGAGQSDESRGYGL